MDEPLAASTARKVIRSIVKVGSVVFGSHALIEMAKDKLERLDVENVLRGGSVGEAEWENGEWRHQAYTARMVVVVNIRSEVELRIVTAWRKR